MSEDPIRRRKGDHNKILHALQNGVGLVIVRAALVLGIPAMGLIVKLQLDNITLQISRVADKIENVSVNLIDVTSLTRRNQDDIVVIKSDVRGLQEHQIGVDRRLDDKGRR